jgi:hypothetical protein
MSGELVEPSATTSPGAVPDGVRKLLGVTLFNQERVGSEPASELRAVRAIADGPGSNVNGEVAMVCQPLLAGQFSPQHCAKCLSREQRF